MINKGLGLRTPTQIYKELSRVNNVWSVEMGGIKLDLARFRRGGKDLIDMRPRGIMDGSYTSLTAYDFTTIRHAVQVDKNNGTTANLKSWFNSCKYPDGLATSPAHKINPVLWRHYFSGDDATVKEPMALNYVYRDEDNPFETGDRKSVV